MRTAGTLESAAAISARRWARLAGLLYLIGSVTGVFGILYGPSLVVGDDAATTRHIMAAQSLFRLSIVSALLDQVIFIFVVVALYQLLRSVNRTIAGLMVIFLLIGVPIAALNELNNGAVLILLNGAAFSNGFTVDQLHALVRFFLDVHAFGLTIFNFVGAPWFFTMGYLVFMSGFLPRVLGVLLVINGLGYLITGSAALLRPDLGLNVVTFTGWVEVVFASWLLIRGINVRAWEERAHASA